MVIACCKFTPVKPLNVPKSYDFKCCHVSNLKEAHNILAWQEISLDSSTFVEAWAYKRRSV